MVTFENKKSQAPSALRNSSPVTRLGHPWLERGRAPLTEGWTQGRQTGLISSWSSSVSVYTQAVVSRVWSSGRDGVLPFTL